MVSNPKVTILFTEIDAEILVANSAAVVKYKGGGHSIVF